MIALRPYFQGEIFTFHLDQTVLCLLLKNCREVPRLMKVAPLRVCIYRCIQVENINTQTDERLQWSSAKTFHASVWRRGRYKMFLTSTSRRTSCLRWRMASNLPARYYRTCGLGIQNLFSTTSRPQYIGQTERFNRTLLSLLRETKITYS